MNPCYLTVLILSTEEKMNYWKPFFVTATTYSYYFTNFYNYISHNGVSLLSQRKKKYISCKI